MEIGGNRHVSFAVLIELGLKIGFEGAYFSEKIRNEANDIRLNYHYITPATTGTWNTTTRTGNCLAAPAEDIYACGNMTLYNPEDPTNLNYLRPRPVGFRMNTGVSKTGARSPTASKRSCALNPATSS